MTTEAPSAVDAAIEGARAVGVWVIVNLYHINICRSEGPAKAVEDLEVSLRGAGYRCTQEFRGQGESKWSEWELA